MKKDWFPKKGEYYICKEFWTSAGKDLEKSVDCAVAELGDGTEVVFVVRIEAVVRRKPGFEVEQ